MLQSAVTADVITLLLLLLSKLLSMLSRVPLLFVLVFIVEIGITVITTTTVVIIVGSFVIKLPDLCIALQTALKH